MGSMLKLEVCIMPPEKKKSHQISSLAAVNKMEEWEEDRNPSPQWTIPETRYLFFPKAGCCCCCFDFPLLNGPVSKHFMP